jgi:hypothetical protein
MLFEQAIKAKKVRKDIVAYQYKNGIISFHRIGIIVVVYVDMRDIL